MKGETAAAEMSYQDGLNLTPKQRAGTWWNCVKTKSSYIKWETQSASLSWNQNILKLYEGKNLNHKPSSFSRLQKAMWSGQSKFFLRSRFLFVQLLLLLTLSCYKAQISLICTAQLWLALPLWLSCLSLTHKCLAYCHESSHLGPGTAPTISVLLPPFRIQNMPLAYRWPTAW